VNRHMWTINSAIIWLLWGGFALLMGDVRVEHNQVIRETWHAWIPIIFSFAMLIIIPIGMYMWGRGGRKMLLTCFALSAVVGIAGFVFHMKDNPTGAVQHIATVLAQPPAVSNNDRVTGNIPPKAPPKRGPKWPPLLAPLAFAGLGLIGVVCCTKLRSKNEVPADLEITRELTFTNRGINP
jgi:hypothetical protein